MFSSTPAPGLHTTYLLYMYSLEHSQTPSSRWEQEQDYNNLHELHHPPSLHPSLSLSVSPPSYLIVSIVFFIIIKASSIFNDCLSSRAKPIGEKLTSLQCSKYEQPNHLSQENVIQEYNILDSYFTLIPS